MFPVSTKTLNKNCDDMLKRIENPSSVETLNIKLRADQILNERRSDEFKQQLTYCLEKRLPFLLYESDAGFKAGNYYIIFPGSMKMMCFLNGRLKAETKCTTINSFANNVHLAIAAYGMIWVPRGRVESKVLLLT